MSKPKYSVLLPTRNRSFVVHHAIRSVLGQTVGDLELVISDNSSNDETEHVVRTFHDDRIRYVRTDRVLGMPDNFENALAKSTGEWITLIPDDCVISSRCLEIVEAALRIHPAKLVVWDWWHFYPSFATEPGRRLQYVQRPFGGRVHSVRSHETLRDLFALEHGKTLPKPYQSCMHRSVFDTLRARLGRAYLPPAPDYTFLTGALAFTDRYTFVDLPMMLANAGKTTPHSSPEAFQRCMDEFGEAKYGGWAPIKVPLLHPGTILVESMCRVKAALPELEHFELDLERYLVDFQHQLAFYGERKFPVEAERRKYEEFVADLPLRTRLRIGLAYARYRARLVALTRAKEMVLKAPLVERLAGMASRNVVVRGESSGFGDIEGAMRHVERTFGRLEAAT